MVEGHQPALNPQNAQPRRLKEPGQLSSYPSLRHVIARRMYHPTSQGTVRDVDDNQIHITLGDHHASTRPGDPRHFGQCPFWFEQVSQNP